MVMVPVGNPQNKPIIRVSRQALRADILFRSIVLSITPVSSIKGSRTGIMELYHRDSPCQQPSVIVVAFRHANITITVIIII